MNEMSLMWMQEVQVHLFFSKFAKLQPKQSVMALVMAGSASTRLVCIFTIHQNVKLMMIAAKLGKLTENDSTPLVHYNHVSHIYNATLHDVSAS